MIDIKCCLTYEDALQTASEYFKNKSIVAIETEYGDKSYGIKNGAVLELLHHGKNANNKSASTFLIPKENYKNTLKYSNFIVSHIDLDTVFGIMWAGGYLKNTKSARNISGLVSYLDTNGFYKFKKDCLDINNPDHLKLLAITSLMSFWKISPETISKDIHKLILRIRDYLILGVPEETKKYVINNMLKINTIRENAFLKKITYSDLCIPKLLVTYISNTSVTDRYLNNNLEYEIIVQYNTGSNSITIACQTEELAIKYFGDNGVIEPLQIFFGNTAGGHKSIGGSPRNSKLQIEYLEAFIKFLKRNYFNI